MPIKGYIRYPRWVNPSRPVAGDIKYQKNLGETEFTKYIFVATQGWVPYGRVSKQQKQKSALRQRLQAQLARQREEGIA